MSVDLRGIREGVRTPFADAAESGKPATKARRRPPQEEPFTQILLHWLPIMQRARAVSALPLLAAIAYEMRMRRKTRIAITAEIWELAGDVRTEAQRRAMINVLRRVPSIVQLEYRQRIGSKYVAHRGLWWSKAPPRTHKDEGGDEGA